MTLTELAEFLSDGLHPGFEVRERHLFWRQGPVSISIEPVSPSARDRGNWVFKAQSENPAVMTIDGADGFPRYYFSPTSLVLEVWAWLEARGLRARRNS